MKKTLLILGTIVSVTAPVVAVISCSVKTKTPTSESLKLKDYISSSQFKTQMELEWQKKLITSELLTTADLTEADGSGITEGLKVININNAVNSELKEVFKYYITYKTNNDPKFIKNLGRRILSINTKVTRSTLTSNGLLNDYPNGDDPFTTDAGKTHLTDDALNLLFNTKTLNMRHEVYKQFIIEKYLSTDKATWRGVFRPRDTDYLDIKERLIEDSNFVLIRELMAKRYFAKWSIELDDKDTGFFRNTAVLDAAKMWDEMFTTGGTVGRLGNLLPRSEAHAHINPRIMSVGDDATLSKLGAFKGFVTMPVGAGTFKFDEASLKAITTADGWKGFVQDDALVTANIRYHTLTEKDKVKVTYVRGIMPYFSGGHFTLGTTGYGEAANKAKLIKFVAMKNSSLYNEAMTLYRTKRGTHNAIFLDVVNQEIKQALDSLPFIKENKPNKD